MARNIYIFFDGTGCIPSKNTTIHKMYAMLKKNSDNLCHYEDGVSAFSDAPILQMVMPTEITRIAINSYKYLIEKDINHEDNIHIFGYSRGAISARILSQLLTKKEVFSKLVGLKNYKFLNVNVQFLGLLDPVIGLGFAFRKRIELSEEQNSVVNTRIKNYVEIIAVDEQRIRFPTSSLLEIYSKTIYSYRSGEHYPQTLNSKDDDGFTFESMYGNRIRNNRLFIWMPGVHSDIGGQEGSEAISSHTAMLLLDRLYVCTSKTPFEINCNIMEEIKKGSLNTKIEIIKKNYDRSRQNLSNYAKNTSYIYSIADVTIRSKKSPYTLHKNLAALPRIGLDTKLFK